MTEPATGEELPMIISGDGTRMLPGLDPLNRPFWTGGARGELLIEHCDACGTWQHPPHDRCAACGSRAVAPRPVSGRGRVISYGINRQAWLPTMQVPFAIVAVELDEQPGIRLISEMVDVDPETVAIGMAVTVAFIQQDEVFIPVFRPAEPAA